MNPLRISAVAAACALASTPHAHALLYVYDGFDYQGVANNTTLVGVDPSASSAGSVGIGTAIVGGGTGGSSNIFQSTGLTLGNLQTRPGGGRYQNTAGAAAFLGYQYTGASPAAGTTLYTSHLAQLVVNKSSTSVVSLRLNSGKTASSGTSYLVTYSDVASSVAASYDTARTAGTGTMVVGTTYMVVGRFTEVGTTAGTRKATTYILNEAQFTNYADGGFSDSEWDTAAIGTGPNDIVARAEDIHTGTTAYNLVANGGIQFGIGAAGSNGGLGQDVLYDEMRCASTLAEALPAGPAPEPASVALTVTDAIATEPTAAVPSIGKVTLSRLDSSTHAVTVNLAITGTATNGSDFLNLPSSLTLPANTNSVSLEVKPIGDRLVESDETVIVTVVAGSGYTVDASQNSATVTIQDGPFTVAPTRLINNLFDGKAQTIVVFGTSLTQGGAWSSQMKAGLDAVFPGKTTLLNTTGSGRNSKWGIANVATEVIAKNPDTVFIEFAVNDAVIRTGYQDIITPAQARINLNAIIDAILTAHPNCEIILQVMNPVVDTTANNQGATARPNLALCQQTYRDVGRERGFLVIDHMPSWQTLLDQGEAAYLALVTDGLHPPSSGYSTYVTPVILREIGAPRSTANNSVMLNATNHRAAEPPTAGGVARTTRITVTRNGTTDSPMVVPLTYGGTATNGTDYAALPASLTIPAGDSSASIELIPFSDSDVEGLETFTVAISTGTGVTLASPSKASLIIEDRPYDQWRKSQFNAADLNDPLISGDLADPDQDGFANLLEFFTGRSPKSRNSEMATRGVEMIGSSDYLTLTYQRVPGNGLTGIPQVSSNLVDWNDGPTFIQESILSDDGLIQTVKARSLTPMSGNDQEFIRLKATRNP